MANAASRRSVNTEARVLFQVSPFGNCGGNVALGQLVFVLLLFSSVNVIPPTLHTRLHLRVTLNQKYKSAKPGNLSKTMLFRKLGSVG